MRSPMHSKRLTSSLCVVLGLVMVGCGPTPEGGGTGGKAGSTNTGNGGNGNGGGGSTGNAGSSGNTPTGKCVDDGTIVASATNNYSVTSKLTLSPITKIKPKSDLSFDWSAVSKDYFLRPIDPKADIILAMVALWPMTPEEFGQRITDDNLGLPAVAAFLETKGGMNSTELFKMAPPAGPIPEEQMLSFFDPEAYSPETNFYTFMIGSNTTAGKDVRMIGAMQLDDSSSNTELKIENSYTKLEYSVDFGNAQPTLVPTGKANLTIDWSGMETKKSDESDPAKQNAMARPFMTRSIKAVKVARLTETEDEVKQKETLLKIYDNGKGMTDPVFFDGQVQSGSKLDLSTLKDADGNSFKGIDSDHRWILALINTDSANPAPWYFTFLKPCN